MSTPTELQRLQDEAEWAACVAMRDFVESGPQLNVVALSRAAYHAGAAYAYYVARDQVQIGKGKAGAK